MGAKLAQASARYAREERDNPSLMTCANQPPRFVMYQSTSSVCFVLFCFCRCCFVVCFFAYLFLSYSVCEFFGHIEPLQQGKAVGQENVFLWKKSSRKALLPLTRVLSTLVHAEGITSMRNPVTRRIFILVTSRQKGGF